MVRVALDAAVLHSPGLRQRQWAQASSVAELTEAIQREGAHEAARLTDTGVAIARAASWDAEPVVRRSFGGDGLQFAQLAQEPEPEPVWSARVGWVKTAALLGSTPESSITARDRYWWLWVPRTLTRPLTNAIAVIGPTSHSPSSAPQHDLASWPSDSST